MVRHQDSDEDVNDTSVSRQRGEFLNQLRKHQLFRSAELDILL